MQIHRKIAAPLAAVLVTFVVSGCAPWSEVRSGFVEPLNAFLHRGYAKAWKSGDYEQVRAFYAPEARESGDGARRALFDRFAEIEYAYSIIDHVEQLDGDDHVRAGLILRVRGTSPGGERLTIEREMRIECERRNDDWRITREDIDTDRDLVASGRTPAFAEEATGRGLDFQHHSSGVLDRFARMQDYSPGAGLAVGDPDGDGFEDVFFVGGDESRLYLNRGDGTFVDVTESRGFHKQMAGEGRCAVFADFDNDGDQDLFVGRIDAPNLLYRNDGGRFVEIGREVGIVPDDPALFETTGACFADFDNDGRLDLYVINGGNLLRHHPDPMYNALNATPNQLYIGNADGTFTNRTEEAGVGHSGWALALSCSDYDLDGDVDIFVGNDVGFNVLYRNRGDATFENVTLSAGVEYRGTTMSAAWGDLDGDGYPDLFGAAMDSNSRWMIDQPGFPAPAPWFISLFIRDRVLEILKEMLWGNRVYLNNRDGTFREVSTESGLRRNGWAWSTCMLDYDNDGDLDLYSVNGFISGPQPRAL